MANSAAKQSGLYAPNALIDMQYELRQKHTRRDADEYCTYDIQVVHQNSSYLRFWRKNQFLNRNQNRNPVSKQEK